jgi:MFS family permease
VLGRKLDSIPFSAYHISIITVLALVGFIEGYDLVMTGSLLVLAKAPLQLTNTDIRWLAVGPTFMLCLGGFLSSAVSDHWSRKTIMLIGVIATTFFTLLIPLVQNAEQLIIVRLLTGIGAGGAVSAAFPIAAELIPGAPRGSPCGRDDGRGRTDHRFHGASAFTATRVYLSEQFPTALRGRGHIFGESFGRLFAGGLAPFLMEPHTGSATIFFGTIFVVVAIGAFIPLVFGRETVGQLEAVTEGEIAPAAA